MLNMLQVESVFETVVEEKEEESTLTSRFCSILVAGPFSTKLPVASKFILKNLLFFCP